MNGPTAALKRPLYDVGNYLAAADLSTDQRYRAQRLRRHNRHLHGWGVVCGLLVVPARDPGRPWAVWVCPGYGLGPWGDEIDLPAPVMLNIRDYLWNQPRISGRTTRLAYVAIRDDEEPVRPVPTSPPGCGYNDPTYVPSRIREGSRVDVLWNLPESGPERFELCSPQLAPCPDCPDSPYVVLARVLLPVGEIDPIAASHIDNWSFRRKLYSSSIEQAQLIECCCVAGAETPSPS